MGVQLLVNFDGNSAGIFRPGDVITGNVIVNTSSSVVTTGLLLSFHGEGYVHWTEQEQIRQRFHDHYHHSDNHHHDHHHDHHHHHDHRHDHHYHHHRHHDNHEHWTYATKEYRNHETYINSIMALPLLGSNMETYATGNPVELQAGYYQQIPFSFQLPNSLPSSCKLAHGGVEYFVEAALKVKHTLLVFSTESRKTVKKEFTILGALELGLVNDVLNPIHLQQQTQFSGGLFCCCSGGGDGEFHMDLRLARKGFVPGEPIIFDLNFSNETDVTVDKVQAYLDQHIRFVTFGKEKALCTRLCTTVYTTERGGGRVVPKTNSSWANQLRIPPNAYLTDLGGCRIIAVNYILTVKASASFGRNTKIELPITVGTVGPIPENYQQY